MPKFATPNAYAGRQSNQNLTGQSRFAKAQEALSGLSDQLVISPLTLASVNNALLTSAATVVAGASPRVSNTRIGQVIFSGVSIAASASQSFVVTNSLVASAATVISAQIYGATDGSALNIKSVTAAAGSFTIVLNNGAGATTDIANLTVTFIVLG